MIPVPRTREFLDYRSWWGWLKLERHTIKTCECSYCNGLTSHTQGSNHRKMLKYFRVRLDLPRCKNPSSWRYITVKAFKNYWYLRWTLPSAETVSKEVLKNIGVKNGSNRP